MEAEKNTGIEYAKSLVDRLAAVHTLELEEYEQLISAQNSETAAYAAKKADFFRKQIYGTDVFIRGLIEVGSCCKNDCPVSYTHLDVYKRQILYLFASVVNSLS